MKKLLLALSLFSPFAFGQSDLFLRSRGLDTDLQLCVNDGGVEGCPIVIDGATKTTTFAGGVEFDEAVGIGTTLPEGQLHLAKAVSGSLGPILVLDNNVAGATGTATEITLLTDVNGSQAGTANARIKAINTNGGSGSTELRFINYNGSSEITSLLIQDNGDTVLTVQDDGAAAPGLCPDGGTVCSGQVTGATYPCANAVNMACLINTISWVRVGGIVTATLTAKGTRTGSVGSAGSFTINAPGNVGAFLNDDGSGPCVWGGGGVSHVPGTITANAGGTILIFEALPVNPSALQVSLDCTFQYHVR